MNMQDSAEKISIHAVTVNHNTSRYTELMLRSFFRLNDLSEFDFKVTVLDNNSNDPYIFDFKEYLKSSNSTFQSTRFDNSVSADKHGMAFEKYILENRNCDYYLFLDSDMWFVEKDTIPQMVREIKETGDDIFAIQARIFGYYAKEVIEGKDGKIGHTFADSVDFNMVVKDKQYVAKVQHERCSPVCCVVKNSPLFHSIVENIGLTPAIVLRDDALRYYDTFGLMTYTMRAVGKKHCVSSKTVNHFTETSYKSDTRGQRDIDVEQLLKQYEND